MSDSYKLKKRKLKLIEYDKNPSLKNIEKWEEKNNIQLPNDFKNFLLKYNACEVESNRFYYKFFNDSEFDFFEVNYFLDFSLMKIVKEDFSKYSQFNIAECFNDIPMIMENYLIISSQYDHEMICLSLNNKFKGSIFYTSDGFPELSVKISNTFTEFLNSSNSPYQNEYEEACDIGDFKLALEIIENGLDFSFMNEDNESILSLAIRALEKDEKFFDIIKLIIDKKYQILEHDIELAIYSKNLDLMKIIFDKTSEEKINYAINTMKKNGSFEVLKSLNLLEYNEN